MTAAGVSEQIAVTVPKAAERLGVSRTFTWRLVRDGVLPSVRIGRRVLVPVRALEEWVEAHTTPGQAAS